MPLLYTPAPGRRLAGEMARFLLIGGLATATSFLGFNALAHGTLIGIRPLETQPVIAFLAANLLAGFVAYYGMKAWTFRHRDTHAPAESLGRFFGLGAATMTIPICCLLGSRHLLGRTDQLSDNISANVIGLALGTAVRFLLFHRFVFIERPAAA